MTGAAGGAERAPPAWEDPGIPFPRNLLTTLRDSALTPGRFFGTLPWDAPLPRPILFYLGVAVTSAFFVLLWAGIFPSSQSPWLEEVALPGWTDPVGNAVLDFFLSPFSALLLLFLWGGWLHLWILIFARARRGYRATLRALCYASTPCLLTAVPVVGGAVGAVWMLVLSAIGLREAHRMTPAAAAAVIVLGMLMPILVLAALALALLVAAFAAAA